MGLLTLSGQRSYSLPVYILRSEKDRWGEVLSRRHVDGSFTSDVNKVLDAMAAKEFLRWVMNAKASGER